MRIASLLFIALTLASSVARAQQPLPELQPFNHIGYYEVSWGGITVGGLAIATYEDAERYSMEAHVKSNGLAWVITKHKSATTAEGIKRDGKYLPQRFETHFHHRNKNRHIILNYDENGKLKDEFVNPADPPWKRKPVPMELKESALDPLSIFFVQRKRVYEALEDGGEQFTLQMFDGRRLTDMHYFVHGRQRVGWNMQDVPVIRFNLSRTPVAGYKDSELEELRDKKDPSVSLFLSDDGRLIPLKLEIDGNAGTFYANFKQRCDTIEQCKKLLD